MVPADDENLLGGSTRQRETVIDASREVGLEVNAQYTECVLLLGYQNAGQNHDIR
jgi:hypothetical protein